MAIVDTSKYSSFLQAWNGLSVVLTSLLTDNNNNNDPDLYALLNRARFGAVSFETALDDGGTLQPSAVDVGSFLNGLFTQCDPSPDHPSNLRTLLVLANTTYHGMFVAVGVGEGTVSATGMHVAWPVREEYQRYPTTYDTVLLDYNSDNVSPHVSVDAADWLTFLRTYYQYNVVASATSTARSSDTGSPPSSVCRLGTGSGDGGSGYDENPAAAAAGRLLIDPTVSGVTADGGHEVTTGVARETHTIRIEYGVNLTPLLSDGNNNNRQRQRQRQLLLRKDGNSLQPSHQMPFRESRGASGVVSPGGYHRSVKARRRRRRRRLSDGSHDYLIHFGGNLAGSYVEKGLYRSYWDRTFFVLKESGGTTTGKSEDVYVLDLGSGSKQIPVIYIPPNGGGDVLTSDQIEEVQFSSLQEAADTLNGEYAYLSFSTFNPAAGGDGDEFSVSLFTAGGDGTTTTSFREISPLAGGQVVPLVYVDGSLDGVRFGMLVGGFLATVLAWDESNPLHVKQMDATEYLHSFGVSDLYLDIVAAADVGGTATDSSQQQEDGDDDGDGEGSKTIGDFEYFVIGPDNQVEPRGGVYKTSSSGATARGGTSVLPRAVTAGTVAFAVLAMGGGVGLLL